MSSQSLPSLEFLSSAAFLKPEDIVSSGWLEHGPFALFIMEALRPGTFVELGTHNGFSYLCFCQSVKTFELETTCHAIDTWKGDEHAGFYSEEVYNEFCQKNSKYESFSHVIRSTFSDALSNFQDGTIDLLHIDGRHYYDDVLEDFTSWLPKLRKDAIVLFHDTNVHRDDFGVWRLFGELQSKYPTFNFEHGHGLGMVAVGDIPARLAPFFNAGPDETAAIRQAYATLGALVSTLWAMQTTQRRLEEVEAAWAAMQAEAERREGKLRALDREVSALQATNERLTKEILESDTNAKETPSSQGK